MSKGLTDEQINLVSLNEVKTRLLLTITFNNYKNYIELEDGAGNLILENGNSLILEPDTIQLLENETLGSLTVDNKLYLAGQVKRGKIESQLEGGKQSISITLSNIEQTYTNVIANYGDILTNANCRIDEVIYLPPGHHTILLENGTDILLLENGEMLLRENDGIIGDRVNLFDGYINNVQLTEVEFKFDVERVLGGYSTQSPNTTYDVNCQWGFRDERCQYSGTLYGTCDKTLTSCQERSNETRFGGYPSIPGELIIRG